MARRGRGGRRYWVLRGAGLVLLLVLLAALYGWWSFIHWTPSRDAYPVQGIEIGSSDGETDFRAFRKIGADFAYLDASEGARGRDPSFARNLRAALDAGLKVGAIHRFSPCDPAEKQAANFVTIVPRESRLLPPVVTLDRIAADCPFHVVDAAVESELMTFLNEIEGHVGKPAILRIAPSFEKHYHTGRTLERNLWLQSDWLQPAYAGRPWMLWTANSMLDTEASEEPVRWVVVQP